MNDSSNITPKFIEAQPDWGKPIQLVSGFRTTVAETRNDGRQRARWRGKPRYALSYSVSAMTIQESALRRSQLIGELQAPIVVPIWTDAFTLDSMPSTHVADLGETLTKKKFKPGSYAYFVQTGKVSTFRKIVSVSGETVTFEAASVPVFTNGATVYPCIKGYRPKTSAAFTALMIDQTDEAIAVEEL